LSSDSSVVCEVQDLTKTFHLQGKEIHVLRNVNLTINAADMCSIRGQSGVGKSTMLHVLGALDRPSSGRVLFQGRDIFALPEPELAAFRNKQIGFVFQFHHLLPEFTAVENVALPGMIARMPRAKVLAMASDLLGEVGMSHRLDHRPGELSGGEQQRVAIARSLLMNPRLVLADEPTGNLDQKTSDDVHELLVKINDSRGVAFVVVTHNEGLARMMSRQLVMRDGVVYEGAS
jgi:lipoprotein-releasing system ATP-binding protein